MIITNTRQHPIRSLPQATKTKTMTKHFRRKQSRNTRNRHTPVCHVIFVVTALLSLLLLLCSVSLHQQISTNHSLSTLASTTPTTSAQSTSLKKWEGSFLTLLCAAQASIHMGITPAFMASSILGFFMASQKQKLCGPCKGHTHHHPRWRFTISVLVLAIMLAVLNALTTIQQVIIPGWFGNPFLWGRYKIYRTSELREATQGVCTDKLERGSDESPLCLSKSSWEYLSAGKISPSLNSTDVDAVLDGIKFAQQPNSGIVINVMSRDTADAIQPLRENVEALVPFFPQLAVVIFENDSNDGSRDAFKAWAAEISLTPKAGYSVDLMECEEAPDCRFGESHRYDATEAKDYFKSSAIGKMALYRQRMSDYISTSPLYASFSHMLVIDLDLAVSLSPLGILHSLGQKPTDIVVSSGRQVWPGSMGTLSPPYDFSAMRFHVTPGNAIFHKMHEAHCHLKPPGDRWRNQCDAASPVHMFMVLQHDLNTEWYEVVSAFNGATLYPLALVRESGTQYDSGEDGQRCEHISYNVGFKKPIYVNPKWNFHVEPSRPGGPTGVRALKNVVRIAVTPVGTILMLEEIFCAFLVVSVIVFFIMYIVYPLWVKIICGTRYGAVLQTSVSDVSKSHHDVVYDYFPELIRKRKSAVFTPADELEKGLL